MTMSKKARTMLLTLERMRVLPATGRSAPLLKEYEIPASTAISDAALPVRVIHEIVGRSRRRSQTAAECVAMDNLHIEFIKHLDDGRFRPCFCQTGQNGVEDHSNTDDVETLRRLSVPGGINEVPKPAGLHNRGRCVRLVCRDDIGCACSWLAGSALPACTRALRSLTLWVV